MLSVQSVTQWRDKHNISPTVLIAVLTVAAFLLRFYRLPDLYLTPDEAITYYFVSQFSAWELVADMPLTQPHFPTYYLIAKGWSAAVGYSQTLMRVPSVFFGALTVPAMYDIGKRMYDESAGILAAVLMAVSPVMLDASQWIRMYSLFAFGVCLSWWRLCCYLDEQTARNRRLYYVSVVFLSVIHYFAILYIATQGLWLLIRSLRTRDYQLKTVFVTALLSLPAASWVTYRIIWAVSSSKAENVIGLRQPMVWDIVRFWVTFIVNGKIAFIATNHYYPFVVTATILLGSVATYMAYKQGVETNTIAFVLWFLLPFLILFAYSKVRTPVFRVRYLIATAPGLYLLLSRATTVNPSRVVQAVLSVLLISTLAFGTVAAYDTNQYGLGPAFEDIETETVETEKVVAIGFMHKVRKVHKQHKDIEIIAHGKRVDDVQLDSPGEPLFIVHQKRGPWGYTPFTPEKMGLHDYRVVEERTYPNVRVYKLQK